MQFQTRDGRTLVLKHTGRKASEVPRAGAVTAPVQPAQAAPEPNIEIARLRVLLAETESRLTGRIMQLMNQLTAVSAELERSRTVSPLDQFELGEPLDLDEYDAPGMYEPEQPDYLGIIAEHGRKYGRIDTERIGAELAKRHGDYSPDELALSLNNLLAMDTCWEQADDSTWNLVEVAEYIDAGKAAGGLRQISRNAPDAHRERVIAALGRSARSHLSGDTRRAEYYASKT